MKKDIELNVPHRISAADLRAAGYLVSDDITSFEIRISNPSHIEDDRVLKSGIYHHLIDGGWNAGIAYGAAHAVLSGQSSLGAAIVGLDADYEVEELSGMIEAYRKSNP